MDIIGINSSALGCGSLQSYHGETCVKAGKEFQFGFSFLWSSGVQMWLHILESPREL